MAHGALLLAAAALAAGCSASGGAGKDPGPGTDTMTMAEMRLDEAGGPSKAAKPAGLVEPVASPDQAPPSDRALTDAGPNTPLGKEWVFTKIVGFDGPLPPAPTDASFLMSRGNGRMAGSTSCNAMSAAFDIDIAAGTLRFRNLTNGQALCSEVAADAEDAVIDALIATDGFRLYGNRMVLTSKGNDVAELVTP